MLSVTGTVVLQSDKVKEVEGKTGDFVYFIVRDDDAKYDCYAFGDVAQSIMKMPLKGGDLLLITAELHKKDAKYLVPDEKWKQGFKNEPNPTKYRNPFFKVLKLDYAIPKTYRDRMKKKEETSVSNSNNIVDMLSVTGFGTD